MIGTRVFVVLQVGVCSVDNAQILGSDNSSRLKTSVNRQLTEAIDADDAVGITKAISQGADLNVDSTGPGSNVPPLTLAILKNKPDVVKILLDAGAAPNAPHNFEYPLVSAVNADTRILKIILQAHIKDLNAHVNERETALEHAASCKPFIYAELIKTRGYWSKPPDCTEDVRLLIAAGADPKLASRQGFPPLDIAIHWNNVEIARLLIGAGAEINEKNGYGRAPLMVALEEYDLEMYGLRKHFQN